MTNVDQPAATPRATPRRSPWTSLGLVIVTVAIIATWNLITTRYDRRATRLLDSQDPADRRQGAWIAATESAPFALLTLPARLCDEPDAGVRAAYLYALGQQGDARDFALVMRYAAGDPDPHARFTAWVAAAHLDPDPFRDAAASAQPASHPWDAIGLARGWLVIGDVRGIPTLFDWAERGTPDQRREASRALYRHIAPLLESVGRWPIDAGVTAYDAWPPELVAEVRRRCAGLDLQAMTDDALPHLAASAETRRNAGKVLRARERIARLLSRL
jgi:HEAT repeat protein